MITVLTSSRSPLRIDKVTLSGSRGQIGMTICNGSHL